MAEKPEDFNMPSNIVMNVIKECLPDRVTVSQDVRSAVSRSASIFILYVTTCANTIAIANKRKTLSAQDVIDAINEIGFQDIGQQLVQFLKAFQRERHQKERQKANKLANKSMEANDSRESDVKEDNSEEDGDEDSEEDETMD